MNSTQNAPSTHSSRKTAPEEYDLVILGSGTGSKLIAWTFGGQGQRVAVVERKYIGGSCPNIACLPSKHIIHTAQVASYVRRSEEFGIARDGFRVDMSAVRDRKRKMVSGLVDIHLAEYKRSGTELILGNGRFIAQNRVASRRDSGSSDIRGRTSRIVLIATFWTE
jgi:pyruvate/2-oxoglutarate dehydrogenase complex dihydrolipoamide dehydrogenase (E3) component